MVTPKQPLESTMAQKLSVGKKKSSRGIELKFCFKQWRKNTFPMVIVRAIIVLLMAFMRLT